MPSHPEDISSVSVNIETASQSADNADHDEDKELLRGIGELHAVAGSEHGDNGLLVLKDDGEQTKCDGANDGGEETSPVVPDGEVHAGDLDAEEDPSDWGGETTGNADGTGASSISEF